MRLILLPLAMVAVAGCRPDVRIERTEGLTAFDLNRAYDRCIGGTIHPNRDDFAKRVACTAAVYGGAQP